MGFFKRQGGDREGVADLPLPQREPKPPIAFVDAVGGDRSERGIASPELFTNLGAHVVATSTGIAARSKLVTLEKLDERVDRIQSAHVAGHAQGAREE